MKVRCKFKCMSHREFLGWQGKMLHEVKFTPVTDGSEENKKFYDATPMGSLEIATIREMPFQLGKDYYLDIEEAE